jgi:hypothetical protein
VDDLHFIRATLRVNHPGPIDEQNPWFAEWFEEGFDQALLLAEQAEDYSGYYFAIQRYMVGFQDGHLGALGDDRLAAPLQRRWPGFLLGLSGDDFLVAGLARSGSEGIDSAEIESSTLPVGARLVACDGKAPEIWAEEILQTYVGLWTVRGARRRLAPFLLIDEGNPWVAMPTNCTFEHDARTSSYDLTWRSISNAELAERLEAARPTIRPTIELRSFGENRFWISLSSFNASDDTVVAAIETVIREVGRQANMLRDGRSGQPRGQFHVRIDGGRSALGRGVHRSGPAAARGDRLAGIAGKPPFPARLQPRQNHTETRTRCARD